MCGSWRGRAARRGSQRLSRRWRRPASRFPQRSVCPRHAGASWVRVFERRRWPGVGCGCGGVRVFHVCTRFCVLERRPPYFASHVQPTIHTHTHTPHTTATTHIRVRGHMESLAPVEGVPAAPRREHSRRAQRRGERAQREHKPNSNTNSRHSAQLSQTEARLHAVSVTTERSPPRRTACGCAPVGPHPTGRRSSRSSHRPRSASHLLHGGVRCGW
mmetsp:Transcript_44594/g.144968  ORF Transcript_44594/g.144968 Transcript_44594/m.144968 type:complete len:216 (-) Transcript_44594:364-1011(-)